MGIWGMGEWGNELYWLIAWFAVCGIKKKEYPWDER